MQVLLGRFPMVFTEKLMTQKVRNKITNLWISFGVESFNVAVLGFKRMNLETILFFG